MKRAPNPSVRSFTLVELLAAMAVFSILVLLIAQIMLGATNTVTINQTRTNVEGQARMIFATMGNDFAHMVLRSDADSLFSKQAGNDYMFYYSEAPGSFDTNVATTSKSPFSVVGYRVNSSYQLERFVKALTWDYPAASTLPATGPPVFGIPGPTATNAGYILTNTWSSEIPSGAGSTPATTTNYQVLGDGVFRLEFCFLRTNGTLSDFPSISNPAHDYGLQDVSAIIVTIAVLDAKNQKLLSTPTTQLPAIIGLLADSGLTTSAGIAQPTSGLMATQWLNSTNGITSSGFAAAAGIPKQAASQIRVYQHVFYLNKI
jgi:type II secretory pathway component PulJ